MLFDLLIFGLVPALPSLLGAMLIVVAAVLVVFADRLGPVLARLVKGR